MKIRINAKSALLLSALVLLMSVSMLAGSTYAWFHDSVTSDNNIVQAGTLIVKMEWAEGKENPRNASWKDAAEDAIFESEKWEPGYMEARHIKITNAGNLDLRYQLRLAADPNAKASNELSDVMDVYIMDAAQIQENQALNANAYVSNLTDALTDQKMEAEGTLAAGESEVITMVLTMRENASIEYQQTDEKLSFYVKLLATQLSYGEESTGDSLGVLELASIGDSGQGTDGNPVISGKSKKTIALSNKNITAKDYNQMLFFAQQGGSLIMNGNNSIVNFGKGFLASGEDAKIVIQGGTYNAANATSSIQATGAYHSVAQNHGRIVIEEGTFTSNVKAAALFLAASDGEIEIRGGFFENTADETPDLLDVVVVEDNINRILIKGGTFVNYNPLKDAEAYREASQGISEKSRSCGIFIEEGYTVTSEKQKNGDIWYSVVPVNE